MFDVTEAPDPILSRRDRLRAATMEEIADTARRLLVESGPQAVSLRAIARNMGMTAPGLYRYYDNREELLKNVCAGIFRELAADIRRVLESVPPPQDPRGGEVARRAHLTRKMVAACREFRQWALSHTREFSLLFGVPLPGLEEENADIAQRCAMEFAGSFYTLFHELWKTNRFPVPADDQIDPALRAQFGRFRDKFQTDVPDGALLVFLRCWILLYGAVSMEVFGHLRFALDNPAPMFEVTLTALADLVGLTYPL